MNPVWINTLERLDKEGELTYSTIPKSIRAQIVNWGERSGCLQMQIRGRGRVLAVISTVILNNELQKLRPIDTRAPMFPDSDTNKQAENRLNNLARYRSTKTGGTRHQTQYFLFKTIGTNQNENQTEFQNRLQSTTIQFGCAALPLNSETKPWTTRSNLLLVENQALFDNTLWLPDTWNGILFYYAGNLSDRLITWLNQCQFKSINLFPDFDGIGLKNYERLIRIIPAAKWYWPQNNNKDWKTALKQFGNQDLWAKEDQRQYADTLMQQWDKEGWPDKQLKELITQMRKHGCMLEQEWVLL